MKKILFLISTSLFFISCASKPTEENPQSIVSPQEQIELSQDENEQLISETIAEVQEIDEIQLENELENEAEVIIEETIAIEEEQLPEILEPVVLDLIIEEKNNEEPQIEPAISQIEEEPVFISEDELPASINSSETELILQEQILAQEENQQILVEENSTEIIQETENTEAIDVTETTDDSEKQIEEIQETVEEPQIIPSRSVTLNKKEYVDIVYPGSGWIFMGAIDNSKNLTYFGRKLGTENTKFTLQAKNDGIVILHFYKNDAITGEYIDDYLEVIVLPKNGSSKTHISAPEYAYVVPKQPEDTIIKQTENKIILPTETENTTYIKKDESEVQTIEIETDDLSDEENVIVIEEEDVSYVEIDTTELFEKAKENFQNQNFNEALSLIIDFLELSNDRKDEALFLQGQIYESSWNGKNIKLAIESYENITKNYPSSSLWDKANKRITYLKRFYLEAR